MSTFDSEWSRCKLWIEAALKTNPFYTMDYIEHRLAVGEMMLWPGKYGAVITEFQQFPNGKALNVFGGGGDIGTALDEFVTVFDPCLCTWAKAAECRWINIYGRPGWQRVGKPIGYAPIWTVLSKEITE